MYGKYYKKRYKQLASFIPPNVSVTDLCSGDSALYRFALRGRNKYTGIDINPLFNQNNQNIKIIKADIIKYSIPTSDYVIIQGSLYQFIPNHKVIIDKMLDIARCKVIISEPIINFVNSKNRIISTIAKYGANPGTGHKNYRFTSKLLKNYIQKYYNGYLENIAFIAGRRDMVIILNAEK